MTSSSISATDPSERSVVSQDSDRNATTLAQFGAEIPSPLTLITSRLVIVTVLHPSARLTLTIDPNDERLALRPTARSSFTNKPPPREREAHQGCFVADLPSTES
jgi:hypothetical protein